MTEKYFKNFPTITYENNNVIDITKCAKITDATLSDPYKFYPLSLDSDERPDQLAYNIYSDPYLGWAIFMSNEIIDPYYDWYMDQVTFQKYIEKKYGSYEIAASKIEKYVVNWYNDVDDISVERFKELSPKFFKYYEPVFQNRPEPTSYRRKKLDWQVDTNMIIKYVLMSDISIAVGEKIEVILQNGSLGTGEVYLSTGNVVIIKNISGDCFPHDGVTFTPEVSRIVYNNISYSLVEHYILSENIPIEEYAFWSPLTSLDKEIFRNEYNKTLKIMDISLIPQFVLQFRKTMNG